LSILESALHLLSPEIAHKVAIRGLKMFPPRPAKSHSPLVAVDVFGLHFPNFLGLAAGFDKNAKVPEQLINLGRSTKGAA